MKATYKTEVLVVGGGPVGMLTALVLGQNDVRASLIDQESQTATHSYACALHPRSLWLLDQAGIAEEVIELGWLVDTIAIYEGAAPRCTLNLSNLQTKYPFALVMPQGELENLLEKKLNDLPAIRFQWNQRLACLKTDKQAVDATVEKLAYSAKGYMVPALDIEVEGEQLVNADFVVGADGQASLVRQCLNVRRETAGQTDVFAVFECETEERLSHEMRIVLDPSGVSVMWPMGVNRCRWSFQLPPSDLPEDFPQKDRSPFSIGEPVGSEARLRLENLLRQRAPWFKGQITGLDWTREISFERWVASQFGSGRVWLAGDSAHQTSPVAMQSMNLGLAEGADLAAHLVQVLRKHASVEILDDYAQAHRDEWHSLLGLNGGPILGKDTPAWLKRYSNRIGDYLPASGSELSQLLAGLGIHPPKTFSCAVAK